MRREGEIEGERGRGEAGEGQRKEKRKNGDKKHIHVNAVFRALQRCYTFHYRVLMRTV